MSAVARMLGDVCRQCTRGFTGVRSHYVFNDKFGRPCKGEVEGMVGYARGKFLVLVPRVDG